MIYVPKHSRDHADSEYVSYMRVDCKGAEFMGNKQIYSLTHIRPSTQIVIVVIK